MIYLNNNTDSQVLFVPRNGAEEMGDLKLHLKSTIGLDVTIDGVIDIKTSSLYHNIALHLPEGIASGEYEYSLKSGEIVLSSGVLAIQDESVPGQYNKTIEYEQYRSE